MRETTLKIRQRAREILNSSPPKNTTIAYNDIYDLINKFNLCQIELDLSQEELHNTQLTLEEYRNRYTDLYNFIPFAYFTFNEHGVILEVNDAGANLIGVKKKQLMNRNFNRYIAPNFQHDFIEYCQQAINNPALHTIEIKLLRKNGPIFYAQLISRSISNLVTGERHILSFISDISDRKNKEEYLHHHQNKLAISERNNSMGELASVIAHELNHPLSVIGNFLNGCIRRLEREDFKVTDVIQALKQASEQSHRISEIVLRMKNFICTGTLNCAPVDINEVIQEVICLVNYETHDTPIQIQYSPVKNFPPVMVDKIHIEQVFLNLARNAIESMRDANVTHPKLTIETNHISLDKIEICISDNGPGVTTDNLHKLFSPYFTSKSYGIGLGLAVSRTIIKAHQGELLAEKNPFGGACFKFTLPTAKPSPSNPLFKVKIKKTIKA